MQSKKFYDPYFSSYCPKTVIRLGLTRKINFFFIGHMIYQIRLEFPQDYEYAIQKILRPLVLELLPKNGN